MQPRIKIIKRGAGAQANNVPVDQSIKTEQQLDRERVNTVKTWVAEWEARNELVKAAAFLLVRSLEKGECSTRRFAVVNG